MKWIISILFIFSLSAQAGTIVYDDIREIMKQITIRIETNPDNGKWFTTNAVGIEQDQSSLDWCTG